MNCKFGVRMRRMCRNRAAMVALGLLIAISAAAPAWGVEPSPEPVDVAKSIMSPVCPGRLIADCPSPESEQLREVIRRKVGEGKSKQQIIDYFVEVYGPEVLPTPPQKGFLSDRLVYADGPDHLRGRDCLPAHSDLVQGRWGRGRGRGASR